MTVGSMDIGVLYQQCVQGRVQLDNEIESLEGHAPNTAKIQRLQVFERQFNEKMDAFQHALLQIKSAMEKRKWERYYSQLLSDKQGLRQTLENFGIQNYAQDRGDLLGGSPTTFGAETELQNLVKENERLNTMNAQIDDILGTAANSRSRLQDSNKNLRNMGSKMVDVAGQILQSTGLVNTIDRRQLEDKLLVYGCMLFCIILFFTLLIWKRWRVAPEDVPQPLEMIPPT